MTDIYKNVQQMFNSKIYSYLKVTKKNTLKINSLLTFTNSTM